LPTGRFYIQIKKEERKKEKTVLFKFIKEKKTKMSWQGYVDNLLQTNQMTHVGIFGLDGASWASSPSFPLSTDNIKLIVSSISDSSKMSNGVTVGQERYILVRNDPGISIMLKKGQSGLVAYKSSQCVIIAFHDPNVKAEVVLTAIGKVIDYLSRHGY
jgi:diphthamide biosynthesis methyltransferase